MTTKATAEIYSIIKISDLILIDFSQIEETNQNTIRKSVDGAHFVIKYNTEPTFISNEIVIPLQVMTHSEAVLLMQTSEWCIPDEF